MKPCGKYRKQIALLAMDSLEIQGEPDLRRHLDRCPNCQSYFAETRGLAEQLRAAKPEADTKASLSFHRGVVEAIANEGRPSRVESWLDAAGIRFGWRVALPIGALAALGAAIWLNESQHLAIPNSAPVVIFTSRTTENRTDFAPTISNYEMIAHQSLDKLDVLLTEQGSRNSLSFPLMTAGQLSLVSSDD